MKKSIRTLRDRFAALQTERERTWAPELVAAGRLQRQRLVEQARTQRFAQKGDRLDEVALQTSDGSSIALEQLLQAGPIALVFFRFAGCPACNIALPYYQEALLPGLEQRGIGLLAVSPQIPGRVQEIALRHELRFPVLTDPANALARRLGILFEPTDAEKAAATARGNFIGDTTGTGTWELPMTAVLLIDRDRVVQFVDISPDWLARTEAEPILAAADALSLSRAA